MRRRLTGVTLFTLSAANYSYVLVAVRLDRDCGSVVGAATVQTELAAFRRFDSDASGGRLRQLRIITKRR